MTLNESEIKLSGLYSKFKMEMTYHSDPKASC
ncbi:hypothetical protein CHRY9390_00858 [Chryseobacterium aquaeductus]|uniref:Uncharacterized protein n=1 Tax=Chryseobacterium aquaeductus TaxID=2675056 RepID=A0A9N8MEJ4_9FLAO|nr:hypothetical protein CHRY9390_00858 [Chryseobacterium potabilaquae]CAD7802000.1 hypothetical protein CHRY9390_00858 [Chryseobacterium aquaeductus]